MLSTYPIEQLGADHPSLLTGNFEACSVARCRETASTPWTLETNCQGLFQQADGVHPVDLTWKSATASSADSAEKTYQPRRVTEDAAVGVCAAALAALNEGRITEVTQHGTGVDYWVDHRRAVLEISGLRKGSSSTLAARHGEKKKQLLGGSLHTLGFPGYVFVVSFGDQEAMLTCHK
jgi:hypothetical protein